MEHAVQAVEGAAGHGLADHDKDEFRSGIVAVLDYLEGFWMGLHRQAFADDTNHRSYHHAA
jgi:hypothetical protein